VGVARSRFAKEDQAGDDPALLLALYAPKCPERLSGNSYAWAKRLTIKRTSSSDDLKGRGGNDTLRVQAAGDELWGGDPPGTSCTVGQGAPPCWQTKLCSAAFLQVRQATT